MHRLLRASVALALLLLGGVAVAGDKEPAGYYPLVPGSAWTYRAGQNTFQLKVVEVKTVDGSPRAKIDLIVGTKVVSHEWVGVTKEGVVRYQFENKDAKPPIEFLKLPPKAGTTWKVESKVGDQPLKGTFVSGTADVKVPAGVYKAVTVTGKDLEANGVRLSLTYYFAEKVGMVKQTIEMAGQKVEIELENYSVPEAEKDKK